MLVGNIHGGAPQATLLGLGDASGITCTDSSGQSCTASNMCSYVVGSGGTATSCVDSNGQSCATSSMCSIQSPGLSWWWALGVIGVAVVGGLLFLPSGGSTERKDYMLHGTRRRRR
jgi:hypothetical protein